MLMSRKLPGSALVFCSAAFLILPAQAFEAGGNKWPGAETEFFYVVPGFSPDGFPWSLAIREALDEWTAGTPFTFIPNQDYRDPCDEDFLNSIDFTSTVCGSLYGSGTLAVTLRTFEPAILGPADNATADIVINGNKTWEIYDGPIEPFLLGSRLNPVDLRRVTLHELGHVIGLGHDNGNPAIMNSRIGDLYRLQPDDIAGVETLYGGLNNCMITPVYFGSSSGALESGDCTVSDLMVGGGDNSFIDVWRLTVTEPVTLQLQMGAQRLDSVILLADDKLRILDLDDNSGDDCDAELSRSVPAGDYFLLANTYDESSRCGDVEGPYQLKVTFNAASQSRLPGGASLSGGLADAEFSGGISADNGVSFGNRFSPDDSLDISGRIVIDPRHHGQPGFLVIGALLNGGFLLKNSAGEWLDFDLARDPLIKAAEKVLEPVELLNIAENLVTRPLGFTRVSVDFYFGYGVDSEPGEVYFHQLPMNLLIEP